MTIDVDSVKAHNTLEMLDRFIANEALIIGLLAWIAFTIWELNRKGGQ